MADLRIDLTSGPLKVQGPFDLFDQDGSPIAVPAGRAVFLCRCGGSTNKPFCDGTHSRIGFQGARRAVQEAEGQ
jgi:CDGSH-type Zn-finger protein